MKPKQENFADSLRQAQPHLIIQVDPLGGPRFELAPQIRQGEYDRE